MRIASGGKPQDGRRVVAVHVGRLGGGGDLDPVAHAPRPAGLGLDIGVLDEGGFEAALDRDGALRPAPPRRRPARTRPLHQNVARRGSRWSCGARRIERRLDGEHGRQLLPGDGEGREVEALDRLALAHDGGHGLAPEAGLAFGEDGLVGEGRDDAEDVAAGNVAGRQHADDAGMGGA